MEQTLKMMGPLAEANALDGQLTLCVPTWYWLKGLNSGLKVANAMGDGRSVYRSGQIGMIGGNMIVAESNLLPQSGVVSATVPSPIIPFNKRAVGYTALMTETNIWKAKNMTRFFQVLMIYDWKVAKPEGLVVGWVYPTAEPT